jgi:uncharacterized protein YneF (UPF0154 family)
MLITLIFVMCLMLGLLVGCVWVAARIYRHCQQKKVDEKVARWQER